MQFRFLNKNILLILQGCEDDILTDETKKKLSGKVIVVDKEGNMLKITKEQYYAQVGEKDTWEWIFHRNKEAMKRKVN